MRQVVDEGEPIVIERGGKAHVVMVAVADYERLLRQQPPEDWADLVDRARAAVERDLKGRSLPPPEEILHQIRKEHDEQLLAMR
jgi:hypothetical protein